MSLCTNWLRLTLTFRAFNNILGSRWNTHLLRNERGPSRTVCTKLSSSPNPQLLIRSDGQRRKSVARCPLTTLCLSFKFEVVLQNNFENMHIWYKLVWSFRANNFGHNSTTCTRAALWIRLWSNNIFFLSGKPTADKCIWVTQSGICLFSSLSAQTRSLCEKIFIHNLLGHQMSVPPWAVFEQKILSCAIDQNHSLLVLLTQLVSDRSDVLEGVTLNSRSLLQASGPKVGEVRECLLFGPESESYEACPLFVTKYLLLRNNKCSDNIIWVALPVACLPCACLMVTSCNKQKSLKKHCKFFNFGGLVDEQYLWQYCSDWDVKTTLRYSAFQRHQDHSNLRNSYRGMAILHQERSSRGMLQWEVHTGRKTNLPKVPTLVLGLTEYASLEKAATLWKSTPQWHFLSSQTVFLNSQFTQSYENFVTFIWTCLAGKSQWGLRYMHNVTKSHIHVFHKCCGIINKHNSGARSGGLLWYKCGAVVYLLCLKS